MTFDEIMFSYKIILSAIDDKTPEVLRCLNNLRLKASESKENTFIPSDDIAAEINRYQSRIEKLKSQIKNMKQEIEKLKTDRRKKLLSIRELRASVKELKKPPETKSSPGVLYYNNEVNQWIGLMNKIKDGKKDD